MAALTTTLCHSTSSSFLVEEVPVWIGGMGCSASQEGKEEEDTKGDKDQELIQVQDEIICGLNRKQRFLLKSSWKGVSRAMRVTGVQLFVKLFEENPELNALFPKFYGLETSTARATNETFQEHAEIVMERVDFAISHLQESPDSFVSMLKSTGKTHTKFSGFKAEYFQLVETPFLVAVERTLDERYTPQMETIYKILIAEVIRYLQEGYNEGS